MLSTPPKVSICIPTYNQTQHLQLLLESIREQQFTDYEIIVSDDSTRPDVRELLNRPEWQGRILYVHHQPSLGSPANWNAAIRLAKGEYVKIMHHDDAFHDPGSLGQFVEAADKDNLDYVFGNTEIRNLAVPARTRTHRIRKFRHWVNNPSLFYFGNAFGAPSTLLIRRSISHQLEYDPAFIWLVDIEYYMRLLTISTRGQALPRTLVVTHQSESQLTAAILKNSVIQIREQAMLYYRLKPKASVIRLGFMQVFLARLFQKNSVTDQDLLSYFPDRPFLLRCYFALRPALPLFFLFKLIVRAMDVIRKLFISRQFS